MKPDTHYNIMNLGLITDWASFPWLSVHLRNPPSIIFVKSKKEKS